MSKDSTPTNTSELAARMRQKQESERREIEALLSEHSERCRALSSDMLTGFERDMEALRNQARRQIRRSVSPLAWIWALAILGALVAAAAFGWTYWQTQTLVSQHQKIVQRRQTLAKLPHLNLTQCDGQPCVQIKPNKKPFFSKSGHRKYMIIQQ